VGKANDRYFDIYKTIPRFSVGTGFKIWTPMIPWLAANVHFVWLKLATTGFVLISNTSNLPNLAKYGN
jgi:hypothetical protein